MKRLTGVPEPALVRSVLVAATGVAAYLLGRDVDTRWIEVALTLYGLLTPVLAGALIRPAVRPITARASAAPTYNITDDPIAAARAMERLERRQQSAHEGRHRKGFAR